jgi:sulfur relay (sulfurtransferase) DsrF/TusC family protein
MASTISVVVRDDPRKSHRPVEALRIALGLAAGDHDVTVVLLGDAPLLLTGDTDDIVDVDILEKYLPSFQQLAIPFVVAANGETMTFQPGFSVQIQSHDAIQRLITTAQHTLVF